MMIGTDKWLRMIAYDGLRVLVMAEDDLRGCFGLFGPPSQPNNVKIRPRACFFIALLMVMLPDVEMSFKSWKITKNFILKIKFVKIENIVRIDDPMYFWPKIPIKSYLWVYGCKMDPDTIAIPSNAQWKNKHGVLFSDFLVGWEARTAQSKVLSRLQPS